MERAPRRSGASRGWPAWAAAWLSILVAALVAEVVLARLSASGARLAVENALTDHVVAQAGLADGALDDLPVEVLVAMQGDASGGALQEAVDGLARAGGLHGLALLGPGGVVMGHGGRWVPAAAERDLIARARAGTPVAGPLYRDRTGELYQTAYRALTGHPGWVVAVEGSAATLGAVDDLERAQLRAGAAVLGLAALLGAGLAALVSGPLRRLGRELSAARPGASPDVVGDYGFREVRQVSRAARELLAAIRSRDAELRAAHRREVEQLTRMAAEIAHEVGNPLNAVALSVERIATVEDTERRARTVERVRGQLGELERIVDRLRDLTRPLRPEPGPVTLAEVVDHAMVEGVVVERRGDVDTPLVGDRGLLVQVVRNLLLNASQAGASTVTVTVTVGDLVSVDIADDGPGVPESQAEDVFSWFHTTRATGTGLGLPHSRRIAEALGGRLDLVQTRPATFRLQLPRERPR